MSKFSLHEIKCPCCGNEFKENIADSLNVTLDNDSFKKVRTGKVFKIKCPKCKKEFFLNHPFLYHDMEKHFMVQYAPDTRTFKEFIEYADKAYNQFGNIFDKGYKYRVVLGNVQQFIEKVEILSYGLNDIAIEAYKEIFYSEMELEDVKDIFIEFNKDFNNNRLAVYFESNGKEPEFYNIDEKVYNSMFELLKQLNIYDRHNDYIVDRRFILKMFDTEKDNSPIHPEVLKELEELEINNLRDKAVKLAKEGKYEEALEILLPIAESGDKNSQNDIGVVYEKLKDFERSAMWYKLCGNELSTENLLKHYDNKRVKFTVEEYFDACNKLIECKNANGYLYLSYIHQNNSMGVEDQKKAFNILLKGLINCEETVGLIFEIGYLLEKGIGCEQDHYKSHMCYEAILDRGSSAVVHYNYALQCYQGRGCKQDINKAIKHYEIAVNKSKYYDAIEDLIEIYSLEEYKNESRILELKSLLDNVA